MFLSTRQQMHQIMWAISALHLCGVSRKKPNAHHRENELPTPQDCLDHRHQPLSRFFLSFFFSHPDSCLKICFWERRRETSVSQQGKSVSECRIRTNNRHAKPAQRESPITSAVVGVGPSQPCVVRPSRRDSAKARALAQARIMLHLQIHASFALARSVGGS